MASYHILIVDGDVPFRVELAEQLALHEGFVVVEVGEAAEASAALERQAFDAILLDVALPDADGSSLCSQLRTRGIESPILLLASAGSDERVQAGLAAGADEVVSKPVRLSALMTRLRAQLRQFELREDVGFRVGPYELRPAARILLEGARTIALTEKEAAILRYLYRAGDQPVSREVLLGAIWGYNAGVTTHTLETHIYRLRQKIEPRPGENRLLVTEADGYRLIRDFGP